MKKKQTNSFFILPTSFLDVLFNLSVVFLALLIMILVIMKTEIVKTKIDAKAEFIVTMTWPEGDWDVDVWVQPPEGPVVYYKNKESDVMNLERDDTGVNGDKFVIDGEERINKLNQEILVVRGIYPGEYIINIHLFRTGASPETGYEEQKTRSSQDSAPGTTPRALKKSIDVVVKLDKINPQLKTLFSRKVTLYHNRQEIHIARFWINDDGTVDHISTDSPVTLHHRTGEQVTVEEAPGKFSTHGGLYSDGH